MIAVLKEILVNFSRNFFQDYFWNNKDKIIGLVSFLHSTYENDKMIKQKSDVAGGEHIKIRFSDGFVSAEIIENNIITED